ncbi:hypothetical protein FGG08_004384 [Glutinoglossum americanum]|uniref:Amidohydrolase-related domain-containing protein n=1 Tax=Glutinoglossum americanum TaxID=1670608 RepID=A0A9P8KZL1_9PEZI|nr:hypothetical protein FGG08_004384 [Glutinoglossum americanum]
MLLKRLLLRAPLRLYHPSSPLIRSLSHISHKIPPNAWDSHMHIIGPPSKYPVSPTARYTPPHIHSLSSALAFESTLNIPNLVLVQPSIYGTDNSCLLDALKALGPKRGRGVVGIDPDTVTVEQLERWHELGVRGVRINLKSVGKRMDELGFGRLVKRHAERVKGLGWVVQLYVDMENLVWLENVVPDLGVRICLDHFASPALPVSPRRSKKPQRIAYDPYALPGFTSLITLLHQGSTYLKLSGAYRISADPKTYRDLEPLALELLQATGGEKLVFATDWPHTRFEGVDVDIAGFAEKVVGWCEGDEKTVEKVFKLNAEDLWEDRREQGAIGTAVNWAIHVFI